MSNLRAGTFNCCSTMHNGWLIDSGASEDQATTGSFLNRFDSFNSVRTNKAHTSSFHSDDESDLFAGTLSFGATNRDNSDGWKAF
jgi:hypothetical protein